MAADDLASLEYKQQWYQSGFQLIFSAPAGLIDHQADLYLTQFIMKILIM